jgi:hypothetical protein
MACLLVPRTTAPGWSIAASRWARPYRAGVLNAEPGGGRAAVPRSGAALSTPGMGDRLGVKVPWRKRWC